MRIDPSAVALPPDVHDADAALSPAPPTSEENQASGTSISSSSSSTRNNSSRGYKLEWREFTSLAVAAGLTSPTTADGESTGNGNGDGSGDAEDTSTVEASASTSTSKPDAEGTETLQPRPLDEDAVSRGRNVNSGKVHCAAGVDGGEQTVDFSPLPT